MIPPPVRTIMLGPPYAILASNVSPSDVTPDRTATASPSGMVIRSELGSGFHSRTMVTSVGHRFRIWPTESAIRVTARCPVQGSLGFTAVGFVDIQCNLLSFVSYPFSSPRSFSAHGSGGSAWGGLEWPFPCPPF